MPTDGDETWLREVACFRCEAVAAALLIDPVSAGRGLTLTLTGFLTRKASHLSEPAANGVVEAEAEELMRWLPPAMQGFFCRECGAAYCRSCWTVAPPSYDEGEYAGTEGVCPAGHQALVDS